MGINSEKFYQQDENDKVPKDIHDQEYKKTRLTVVNILTQTPGHRRSFLHS